MRKLILSTAAILLMVGCGADVGPGTEMEDEITREGPVLEDEWPDCVEILVGEGRPVEDDILCAWYTLQATDTVVVLEVESDDFDPVVAVLGENDELLGMCDDWEDELWSRVVLDGVPSNARLFVFSPGSDRGFFDLECYHGDQDDLEEFESLTTFRDGLREGYKSDEKDDDVMEDFLEDAVEDEITAGGLDNARIVPFEVEIEQLVSIGLRSDDFDPYLVLMEVDDDEYEFVEYNDDSEGLNSRISRELEEGRYYAVVLSYDADADGDFELQIQTYSEEDLEKDVNEAPEPGVIYEGQIRESHSLVLAYWPNVESEAPAEVSVSLTSPTAAFSFPVEEPWIYDVDAFADFDVVLALLSASDDGNDYVGWNDDHEGGTDSRITRLLPPGEYLALVCSYQDSEGGEVGFSFQEADVPVGEISPGDTVSVELSEDRLRAYLSFELGEETSSCVLKAVSAEEGAMDPVVSLVTPDGTELEDDDGGEGYDSRLQFGVDEENVGTWLLSVWDYGVAEGTIDVILECDTVLVEEPE
ncbi:hypothetical protein GF402_02025 [Candidatus Fermentibacteria bacterium]|nr:hypothetical protein [Candidatus Fermentibacteria bacterium]